MDFYKEMEKRATELGGSIFWQNLCVAHGSYEKVMVVRGPDKNTPPKPSSNNLSDIDSTIAEFLKVYKRTS